MQVDSLLTLPRPLSAASLSFHVPVSCAEILLSCRHLHSDCSRSDIMCVGWPLMNARKVVELLIGWTKVRELMESSGRVLLLKSYITLFYIFDCFFGWSL